MMNYYYKDSIASFLDKSTEEIIGEITLADKFDGTINQRNSWQVQIPFLQKALRNFEGAIFFEFSIPRMGKRVDVIVIIKGFVFVIEFKVGEHKYHRSDMEQVWDYALDLKNFHEPSHEALLVPILVATEAKESLIEIATTGHNDNLLVPIKVNKRDLRMAISRTIEFFDDVPAVDPNSFAQGRYYPTPTIIEAALSLYNTHTVDEITRSDAEAKNLTKTTAIISSIIDKARLNKKKIICFVTGVPGAGKP